MSSIGMGDGKALRKGRQLKLFSSTTSIRCFGPSRGRGEAINPANPKGRALPIGTPVKGKVPSMGRSTGLNCPSPRTWTSVLRRVG
jgi:hypothetical protein